MKCSFPFRFPIAELHRKNKAEVENKDGSDTEDDDEEGDDGEADDDDDDAGDEDFSGDEGEMMTMMGILRKIPKLMVMKEAVMTKMMMRMTMMETMMRTVMRTKKKRRKTRKMRINHLLRRESEMVLR